MRAHRISQKNFAEYTGIPYRTLIGWMYRNIIPDASRAVLIAEALGTTVEYLVRGTGSVHIEDHMQKTHDRKTAAEEIDKLIAKLDEQAKKLK